jgi:hypothetical protein
MRVAKSSGSSWWISQVIAAPLAAYEDRGSSAAVANRLKCPNSTSRPYGRSFAPSPLAAAGQESLRGATKWLPAPRYAAGRPCGAAPRRTARQDSERRQTRLLTRVTPRGACSRRLRRARRATSAPFQPGGRCVDQAATTARRSPNTIRAPARPVGFVHGIVGTTHGTNPYFCCLRRTYRLPGCIAPDR